MEEATKTTPETPVPPEQQALAPNAPGCCGNRPNTPAAAENDEKKTEPHPLTDEEIRKATDRIRGVDCTVECTVGEGDAVKALEGSIVPMNMVTYELRKYVQFLIDHSDLRAAGVHAVCGPNDGKYLGTGFVALASDVTAEEGMLLVNAGDANIDEYIARSKLQVPGRSARPQIVTPTDEQVANLG